MAPVYLEFSGDANRDACRGSVYRRPWVAFPDHIVKVDREGIIAFKRSDCFSWLSVRSSHGIRFILFSPEHRARNFLKLVSLRKFRGRTNIDPMR